MCEPTSCGYGGRCINKQCVCFAGFFGPNSTDCSIEAWQKNSGFWLSTVIINSILYWILVIWILVGIVYYIKIKNNKLSLHTKTVSLFCLLSVSLASAIILSVDPVGFNNLIYPIWSTLLLNTKFYSFFAMSGGLVFHWVDFYEKSIRELEKLKKIQQINRSYSKPVIMQEVISRIKFIKSYKFPFVIFVVFDVAIMIVMVMIHEYVLGKGGGYLVTGWAVFSMLVFFAIAFIAWIYARKLGKIIPAELEISMRKETKRVVILIVCASISYVVSNTITGLGLLKPEIFVYTFAIGNYIVIGNIFAFCCITFPFWTKLPKSGATSTTTPLCETDLGNTNSTELPTV